MPPIRLLLALATAASLWACDNDVELLSDDPGLPVVYGLIDGSRDVQLASISRTFRFDADGNALESAREQDSVYYSAEGLSVVARNLSNGMITTLERVDLAAEGGAVRSEGVFVADPNVAYRYRLSDIEAVPGDSVLLEGSLANGRTFTAGGRLLQQLDFASNNEFQTAYSLIAERGTTRFAWRRVGPGAPITIFDVGLNIAISETSPAGTTERVLYYPLIREAELPGRNSITVDNERFRGVYGFLSSRLEAREDITRQLRYVQGVVTGADSSFVEFQTLVRANSGITATQELPPFSNVEGALGLVSLVTRLAQEPSAGLLPQSLDSLRLGQQTRDLNFQ